MAGTGTIQYITNERIDKQKWDNCIATASNSLIYAYAGYLDTMARNWDAFVLNDYQAVMPLPWKQKWGIRYLYQPPFTQQLGIFTNDKISPELTRKFYDKIVQHFRFAEIFLNYENAHHGLKPCTNFILSLDRSYAIIAHRYKNVLVKNLKRAAHQSLQYTPDISLDTALTVYRKQYAHLTPHVSAGDFGRFEQVCRLAEKEGDLLLRAVLNKQLGLLATGILLRKKERLYLMVTAIIPGGRKKQAGHFLIDQLIKEFSGEDMLLDFEGSDIPGISSFFENFGGVNQPYYFLRINRLPWLPRLFKPPSSVVLTAV